MTSSSKRIVVAINPNASFGRGREVGPAVVTTLRALGHEVTLAAYTADAESVEVGGVRG